MAKKFADLRAGMSAPARESAHLKAKAMLDEMPLNELRQARGLSQKMLAEVLHVQQWVRGTTKEVAAYRSCAQISGG